MNDKWAVNHDRACLHLRTRSVTDGLVHSLPSHQQVLRVLNVQVQVLMLAMASVDVLDWPLVVRDIGEGEPYRNGFFFVIEVPIGRVLVKTDAFSVVWFFNPKQSVPAVKIGADQLRDVVDDDGIASDFIDPRKKHIAFTPVVTVHESQVFFSLQKSLAQFADLDLGENG